MADDDACEVVIKVIDFASLCYQDDWEGEPDA